MTDISALALVIPLITTHVNTTFEPNNNNIGLGVDYTYSETITVSTLYMPKNSFNKSSLFVGASKTLYKHKDFNLSIGAALATGYEIQVDYKVVPVPLISMQYGYLRLVTSYPLGTQVCSKLSIENIPSCGDFINIQAVISF